MTEQYDVVISGGGPVGLFVACELGLHRDLSILVLEHDPLPSPDSPPNVWKSEPLGLRGLNTASVELFYRRGLLGGLFDLSKRADRPDTKAKFQMAGNFAGNMVNGAKIDLNRAEYKYVLPGPGLLGGPTNLAKVTEVLAKRAEELGVTILRGTSVSEIVSEDASGVTIVAKATSADKTTERKEFRGRYLVGADGARGPVRKLAGFEAEGADPTFTGYISMVRLSASTSVSLKPGFQPTKNGMYILRPGPTAALYMIDFDGGAYAAQRRQQGQSGEKVNIRKEHLTGILRKVTANEKFEVEEVIDAGAFTDRTLLVKQFRKGRILLAGDAAHVHAPLGGQGMNLGLGDACNLGWKLAATIEAEKAKDTKTVDLTLLDTYHTERHAAGEWMLSFTRGQTAMLHPDIQPLVRDFVSTTDGANVAFCKIGKLNRRYELQDATSHPLVGFSMPDLELEDGSRLGPMMSDGQGLLVELGEGEEVKGFAAGFEGKIKTAHGKAKDSRGIRAMLVRPDGIVLWAAEEGQEPDLKAAKMALERWFSL
jgi:2-polyprenyl-6-methoxyphenol hydroxylase-like FAD-dependent oxidoreductase